MSNSQQQQAMILAELKAIKALISEIGIQKFNGANAPEIPQQASIPAAASPIIIESSQEAPVFEVTPRDKFLALLKNAPDEAERYLYSCSDADLKTWETLPVDIEFPTAKLFFLACRRGLVDLETTAGYNLHWIFHKSTLHMDREWCKNRITPVTAARLRALKVLNYQIPVQIVEFLCASPCCLDRMQFAWELLDTEGNPVFPAADFWRHTDFLKGDLTNPAYVRWWAKNVMAAQEMPELME